MRILYSLALLAYFSASASAAVVLRGDSASFTEGSTMGTVDFFISSDSNDQVLGLFADFTLADGGDFADPPGIYGVDTEGFYGFGALNAGGSNFVRSAVGVANIGLEFDVATAPPATEILFARVSIVLDGLAQGTYAIVLSDAFAFDDTPVVPAQIPVSTINGSFTITAVPEPSALFVLTIGSVATLSFRRRIGC